MVQEKKVGWGARTGGGALAGLIAGAIMLSAAMGWLALAGLGALTPPKLVAAGVSGVSAMIGGAGTAIGGWALHLGVAVILGIIFAWLAVKIEAKRTALFCGILYAIGVWAVMTFAIMPAADPVLRTRIGMWMGTWFWWHLIYGAMLFMTPALERSLAHRPAWQQRDETVRLPKAS